MLLSATVCLVESTRLPAPVEPAGQDLAAAAWPVGEFQLIERSGRTVTASDFADRVWIAAFIFTRCPLSCPRISSVMKDLQARLAGTDVLLVSTSVDPEHDTPEVLAEYARRFAADPARWWFLTGNKDAVDDLVVSRFKLALAVPTAAERAAGAEAIAHSDRLVLVDRGRITGFFDSTDKNSISALVASATRKALPGWVRGLPSLNACLNALCAILLAAGWTMIRRRERSFERSRDNELAAPSKVDLLNQPSVRGHVALMLLAVLASALFLSCYLVYHFHAGSVPFKGVGAVRVTYRAILLSHTVLATLGVVPLLIVTLTRAFRRRFAQHATIAQVTFPIWMYVSITGVIIYVMLYHWTVNSAALSAK